ncbi:hypothetical protein GYMLUDRAFT_238976 [Collybiopsis luxurians FD-317 M1]|nr:hypothetical protein GYMLUDRAFT_238976 [Collybiopsis luxurians FD-317 M1]
MSLTYKNSVIFLFDEILRAPLTLILFDMFLYGAYVIIFSLYMYLQVQQQGRNRYYQVSISILFLLSTASVAVSILNFIELNLNTLVLAILTTSGLGCDSPPNLEKIEKALGSLLQANDSLASLSRDLTTAFRAIYAAVNIIADTLLLYRCYIMWAPIKRVMIGLGLISAINAGMAITSVIAKARSYNASEADSTALVLGKLEDSLFYAFLGVNFLTNLILTGLIDKIWWLSRQTQKYLGCDSPNNKRMSNHVAIILESGLLYPLALLACIIAVAINESRVGGYPPVESILTVIVGIAPTMIMVRADSGISIESTSSANSNVDCKSLSGSETRPLSPPHLLQDAETFQPLPLRQLQEDPNSQEHLTPFTSFALNPVAQKYRNIHQG